MDKFNAKQHGQWADGLCLQTGLSKGMLDDLSKQRVLTLSHKEVKIVGGAGMVTLEIIRRCLGRMCAYTKLSKAILSAECPFDELLKQFWPFDVEERSKGFKPSWDAQKEVPSLERGHGLQGPRTGLWVYIEIVVEALWGLVWFYYWV